MKSQPRLLFILLLWSMLVHCQAIDTSYLSGDQQSNKIKVSELVFDNQTSTVVEQVTLRVVQNGSIVSCGFIASESQCATGFPLREYQANPISVRWISQGVQIEHRDIYLEQELNSGNDRPAVVKIYLLKNGQIDAKLEN